VKNCLYQRLGAGIEISSNVLAQRHASCNIYFVIFSLNFSMYMRVFTLAKGKSADVRGLIFQK
jgi:hypothetical protein